MKDPIDVRVGMRLREFREAAGLTLQALAALVGVSYQQLQKYEEATNRIAASRLYKLSEALDVSIGAFFTEDPIDETPEGAVIDEEAVRAIALMSSLLPRQRRTMTDALTTMVKENQGCIYN